MIDFDKIFKNVMQVLEMELPDHLVYHNLDHTKYVLDKSILIAQHEGIFGHDLTLVKIAALYHDIGFIKKRENHESISCSIAKDDLVEYGLCGIDIDKICGMIMATKIPQKPSSPLEDILADADLEYLGTDKFERVSERLFKELRFYNPELGRKEWFKIQRDFLTAHQYHTKFCRDQREYRKSENLDLIIRQLSCISQESK